MQLRIFFPRYKRAFTLIELLVVMSIIAVLMSLSFAVVHKVRSRARIVSTRNVFSVISQALLLYRDASGGYPNVYDNTDAIQGKLVAALTSAVSIYMFNDPVTPLKTVSAVLDLDELIEDGFIKQNGSDYFFYDSWGSPILYFYGEMPAYQTNHPFHHLCFNEEIESVTKYYNVKWQGDGYDLISFGPDCFSTNAEADQEDDLINF